MCDFKNVNQTTLSQLYQRLETIAKKVPGGKIVAEHIGPMKELLAQGRLEAARNSGDRALQLETARAITKAVAAICTAIGMQPIPLADLPLLTALQLLMVGAIMYVSGRNVSRKAIAEFVTIVGANFGAAFVLRQSSRVLLKLLPIWGDAISGAVAGAGTLALGKAATAYFIEGVPLEKTRSVFRRALQAKALLLKDKNET